MNEIIINIISVLVTAVIIPLITWGGTELIKLIQTKVKNEKATEYLTVASTIVMNAVKTVFQTYVDSLKKSGKFTKETQEEALFRAKEIVIRQINDETKEYIKSKYGSFEIWLNTQIESTIDTLKNS